MPATGSLEAIRERSGWVLALGIVQIVVGVLAIGSPLVATLASALVLGWLLLISGVVHAVESFQVRAWSGFLLHLLGAILYMVAGLLVITRPVAGALTLTLILAAFLLVEGVSRMILAFQVRDHVPGWPIWMKWPSSAIWAIGLMLGVNLLFSGTTLLMLALAARRTAPA
jgi:uncharacterized membrane protein HdeD (DUF308 family)